MTYNRLTGIIVSNHDDPALISIANQGLIHINSADVTSDGKEYGKLTGFRPSDT